MTDKDNLLGGGQQKHCILLNQELSITDKSKINPGSKFMFEMRSGKSNHTQKG